jgi:hypothetical protein
VNLYLVKQLKTSDLTEALVVPKGSDRPIWQSYGVSPMPGWKTTRNGVWYKSLKENVDTLAVRSPILVWDVDGAGLAVVKGTSRLRACLELGITRIPALVAAGSSRDESWEEITTGLYGALSCFPWHRPYMAIWQKHRGYPFYAEWETWRKET